MAKNHLITNQGIHSPLGRILTVTYTSFISLAIGSAQKVVVVNFVKVKGIFYGQGHFNAKFMGPFQVEWISFFDKRDDLITLLKDMQNLPYES